MRASPETKKSRRCVRSATLGFGDASVWVRRDRGSGQSQSQSLLPPKSDMIVGRPDPWRRDADGCGGNCFSGLLAAPFRCGHAPATPDRSVRRTRPARIASFRPNASARACGVRRSPESLVSGIFSAPPHVADALKSARSCGVIAADCRLCAGR